MRSIINPTRIGMTLLLIILPLSCARFATASVPKLELRTLRLNPDAPGFIYQYEECVSSFIGICFETEMKIEKYDLTDQKVRSQLIDMGFVAKVRDKI